MRLHITTWALKIRFRAKWKGDRAALLARNRKKITEECTHIIQVMSSSKVLVMSFCIFYVTFGMMHIFK